MKELETLYMVGHVDLLASVVMQCEFTIFSIIISFSDTEEQIVHY